ncbi:MAG: hypothetical protein MRY83_04725 [Flavobacteriales bacterium]|nr:hypothetical protein [Flavobacteriales bacterium]
MKKLQNQLWLLVLLFVTQVSAQTEALQELKGQKCTFVTDVKDFRNIKDVEVHTVGDQKFEYNKGGSLHDLYYKYIKWIETPKYIFAINKIGRWEKIPRNLSMYYLGDPLKWKSDLMVSGKDSVRCKFFKMDSEKVSIWPSDGSKKKEFLWGEIDLWVHDGVKYSTSNHIVSMDSSFVAFDLTEDQLNFNGKRTKCDIYAVTPEDIRFYIRVNAVKSLKESVPLEKDVSYVWNGNLINFHSDLNIHVIQLKKRSEE